MKKTAFYLTLLGIGLIYSCSKDNSVDTSKYQGTYNGTFSGGDYGTWTYNLDSKGVITGSGYSQKYSTSFTANGSCDANGKMSLGNASTGATFNGLINSSATPYSVSGTWSNTSAGLTGSFSGVKQ